MAQQNVARLAFNRGRVSPLALARTDIERVELSAEEQTNFVPRVLGSMMLRPGWKYLGSTLGDNRAYHVEFIKSTDDTALLEFTNESLRVYVDDIIVERNSVSTVTRGGDFASESPATLFTNLTDPSSLPTAGGGESDIVFSPNGIWMAHVNTNEVKIYYISGTTFTLASTFAIAVTGARFSPDSQLVAFSIGTGVRLYTPSGETSTSTWSQIAASPVTTSTSCRGVDFSPDGTLMAVSYVTTSPFCDVFSVTGSGASATFTQLTGGDAGEFCNAADYPAGNGRDAKFSWDGRYLAIAHDTTPFVTIYEVNGTTFTKLANPASLPAGNGQGIAWSRDGNWMVVGHSTTPFITIYAKSGNTFTKQTNPGTLPASSGWRVDMSSDNQFIAIAHSTTPFVTIYRNVSGTWTKQTNPSTLPDGNASGVAFSWNNRFLGVNHATSQFITLYENYNWLDMDGTGASSTYGGISPASFQTAFDPTISASWGIAAAVAGATVRQIVLGGALTRTGDRVKITFKAGGGSFGADKVYIGKQASSGDVYDFASAPTQVTFSSGSASFSLAAAATITSDEITFDFDGSAIVVAFHITSNTVDQPASNAASSANLTPYYKLGADDSSTVNATGYTLVAKDVVGVDKIEVLDSTTGGSGLYFVGTGYNEARRVQAVSVLNTDKAVEHSVKVVVSQGQVTFAAGTSYNSDDLIGQRLLEAGTHTFAFTPNSNLLFFDLKGNTKYSSIVSSLQVETAGDMVLATPYTTDDLPNLRYWQSGDVLYLACNGVKQMKVLRYGDHSWGIVEYLPQDGPWRDVNTSLITLTASALTGDITLTASRELFKEEMVGTLFRIASVGQATQDSFNGANQFSNAIKVTGVDTSRNITIVRSGTWTATVTLQRSISEPGTWVDVATFTSNGTATYNDGLDNQVIYYRIGIKTGNYTSGTAVISLSYSQGTTDGVARITDYNSPTVVEAIVLSPMGGTTAFETWNEGLWSAYRGYPSAVAIYESRLAWAGLDRVVLSVSDEYESFDDTIEGDSGPISRTIGEGPVDDINWLLPLQRLIVGAQGSERSCRSTSFDEPLTPDNFNMKPASTQGSASVGAIIMDSGGAFVDRTGTRLFQLIYNFDTYDYSASELTRLVPEIASSGITRIAVQRRPDTRIHCVKGDGTVALLVFEKEEDTICWVDIETDGSIEDVCVLPDTPEDAVYYTVKRTIGGVDMRYLERWALEEDCQGGTKNKQADAFVEYTSISTATLTGLDHLEGETVVCWADGIDQGSYTVSSGSITLPGTVSNAIVGLPYTARYKSTKLAYAAAAGTALNRTKRVESIGLILYNTHHEGLRVGDDYSFLRALPTVIDNKAVVADTIHATFDHEPNAYNTKWSTDSRICMEAQAPRPVTCLALTFGIETVG